MTEQDQVGTKIVLEKTPEQIEQEKKKERLLRVGKLKISEVGKYFEQAILDQNAIIMPDHLTLISIREILLENAQSALTLSKERTEPYVQGRRFASEPNIPRGIQILIAVLQNLALTNSGAKPEQFIKDNLDQELILPVTIINQASTQLLASINSQPAEVQLKLTLLDIADNIILADIKKRDQKTVTSPRRGRPPKSNRI